MAVGAVAAIDVDRTALTVELVDGRGHRLGDGRVCFEVESGSSVVHA